MLADAQLAELPAGFCYAVATPEQQDDFLKLLGRLIGQEHLLGTLNATREIEEVIVATKAHILRPAVDETRARLKKRLDARNLLASHDETAIEQELAKLTAVAERAKKKLADAATAHDTAVAEKKGCQRVLDQLAAAKAEMAKSDVAVLAACELIEQHENQTPSDEEQRE